MDKQPEVHVDSAAQSVPDDALIIIPVRNMVLFPGTIVPIAVSRSQSVAAAQAVAAGKGRLGIVLQRNPEVDDPTIEDLHGTGTSASILRYITDAKETHHLVCNGDARFRIKAALPDYPYTVARVEFLDTPDEDSSEIQARARVLKQQADRAIELLPLIPTELGEAVQSIESPGSLGDLIASFLDISAEVKQEILETTDVSARLDLVIEKMAEQLEVIEISHEIETKTKESFDERQREAVLREQLHTIQKQLGEDGSDLAEIESIENSIKDAKMPPEAEAHALKELAQLKRTSTHSAEYSTLRTHLDWLTELPWSVVDSENIDIRKARKILDEDHYGLAKVKQRIVEFLAVRKLNPEGCSTILCLTGPPGVGKTSLGKSMARAVGLQFVRISLGGLHDEAEIRGHRQTYIGSLPGKIIQGLKKAGTRNPLFMLDEIDKMGAGAHGDPASALLEVLDPHQNAAFADNYLGVDFDLSRVLFVATANRLDTIPAPLLDRMEVIELSSYTVDEKVQIARRYLVDRQSRENGIDANRVSISDDALESVITNYTREAGCRNLEKQLGAIFRHIAVRIAEGENIDYAIGAREVATILGTPRYENELALRAGKPGVATGLAWTPVGGDILFVESTMTPGDGRLILTGQLGDVMKESAQAALSLLKSRAAALDLDISLLAKHDFHLHVPAGAIPKDGPSAGVAMFVALTSLVSGKAIYHDVAMTGEISLRGDVLPIGGLKEKVIAAHRAGIKSVLLPARNRKDLDDIPESVCQAMKFVYLENVEDALRVTLHPAGTDTKTTATAS